MRSDNLVLACERHGERSFVRRLGRLPDLCETEIEQLDASLRDENVGGL
jgi:hypothetical protein